NFSAPEYECQVRSVFRGKVVAKCPLSPVFALIFPAPEGIIEHGSICRQRRLSHAGVFWNPRRSRRVQGETRPWGREKIHMDSGNKRPARRPAPAKRRPRGKSSPLPLIIIALATLLIVALAI